MGVRGGSAAWVTQGCSLLELPWESKGGCQELGLSGRADSGAVEKGTPEYLRLISRTMVLRGFPVSSLLILIS